MNRIRVLLVDDHRLVRKSVHELISTTKDMEVVGEARTGVEAVQLFEKLKPDVVLMDISMPGMNGIDATKNIISQTPCAKVIALSNLDEDEIIEQMRKAGASGYLVKDSASEHLLGALRDVHGGGEFFSPEIR